VNLLKFSDRDAFDIEVALPFGGKLQEVLEPLGFKLHALLEGEKSLSKAQTEFLKNLMAQKQYDVVHTHASLSGRLAARAAGVPVKVYTRHGFAAFHVKSFVGNLLLGPSTDAAIAVSEAVGRSMAKEGVPKKKIQVIHNGIDLGEYFDIPDLSFRKKWGVSDKEVLLGVIARLVPVKGHQDLLKALVILKEEKVPFRCVLVGDGSLREELEQTVEAFSLSREVIFAGYVKEVASVIRELDLSVLPSRNEGLGLAILESMACGVPVAASEVGGIPEIIKDNVTGALFKAGDPASMAAVLKDLILDESRRKDLGRSARALVSTDFDATSMAKKTEALYMKLLAGKGAGA